MSETAEKSDPALWEKVKNEVTAGAVAARLAQTAADSRRDLNIGMIL